MWIRNWKQIAAAVVVLSASFCGSIGCATNKAEKQKKEAFFTSGNAEADRRADAQTEKNAASGKAQSNERSSAKGRDGEALEKAQTLYDRLGGRAGISAIVDDFLKRAMGDPRVNWERDGVKAGLLRREEAVKWEATPESTLRLKEHFVQFISLAAGGPTEYQGQPVKSTHARMKISKSEFDAAIGDLKATMDLQSIPNDAQKELLAIFESTRQQIVTEK